MKSERINFRKIDLNTVRPLGRKLFLNAKRRLKLGNAANGLNSSAVNVQSTWADNSKTDALSIELSNLTLDNFPEAIDDHGERQENDANMEVFTG